jgi:hypothetical protein
LTPLIAFGASLHAFADGLRQCPLATVGVRLPLALEENDPDCLLTRGVSGGDAKAPLWSSVYHG